MYNWLLPAEYKLYIYFIQIQQVISVENVNKYLPNLYKLLIEIYKNYSHNNLVDLYNGRSRVVILDGSSTPFSKTNIVFQLEF